MEAVFFLFFIIFVFWLLALNARKRALMIERESMKPHRHGHRCYIDEELTPGELEIVHLLASNLSHQEYFLFNNLIVPSDKLVTTQIDHVVVSRYGIFVIESKDYSGWIFAYGNRKEWTQTFPNGSKYPLSNPLWQNFAHICALREHLPFIKNQFLGMVVFSNNATFKTPKPKDVVLVNELVEHILSYKQPILKEVELLVVIGKLSMLCQTVDVAPAEHIQNIENRLAQG